ncbi:MAG TPA: response regulator transcription factor [Jatrophihabitans sp.]|nr:response regulator transcription factor [Jatrophihabitans sp.]
MSRPQPAPLQVLVVDDEAPAREELAFLLRSDPRVGQVRSAADGVSALRELDLQPVDAVFCDIRMPGLDGMQLAKVLARFADRPHVVFVTAYDSHAVDAFDLQAVDYLMKPVHQARVAEAVRRIAEAGGESATGDDESIPIELAGVTRFVRRSEVRYVEAQGDYARLHTRSGSHLIRVPLAVLEERWADAFVRIHRSTLVALRHIDELRIADGHCSLRVGEHVLPVSRRHTRQVRDLLVRAGSRPRPEA